MKKLIIATLLVVSFGTYANESLDNNAYAQQEAANAAQESADAQQEAADAAESRTISSVGSDAFYQNEEVSSAQADAAMAAQESADAQQDAADAAEEAATDANY
ncbi:TPA: hypothetical protein OTY99_002438 [Citrobacter freundii]|nr:hypothetical protein [Citrobacter freundii]HCJ7774565.1 hypothetical protein [Citrobacter freundii]HCT4952803.1 hypothetical protein [Citrobacter freundii]HEI8706008.1 hypothetical protein [Citrobacter freundii]